MIGLKLNTRNMASVTMLKRYILQKGLVIIFQNVSKTSDLAASGKRQGIKKQAVYDSRRMGS